MTISKTKDVVDALLNDLQQLSDLAKNHGTTPFLIRLYARTIFSIFDGYAYDLKQKARRRAGAESVALSKSELEMIRERYIPKGQEEERPKNIPTAENLRFAIKLWSRLNGGERPPNGGQLPPEFERVRNFRNRITHPKKIEDFDVAAEDARSMGALFLWFRDITDWTSRIELASNAIAGRRFEERNDELERQIRAAGPIDESRKMTIEEMYTAPRIRKPED